LGKNSRDRDPGAGAAAKSATASVSRRAFLSQGAAGAGVAALVATGTTEAAAQSQIKWDLSADVVVIGAGVAGLPAAITARDLGRSSWSMKTSTSAAAAC
jgi:NADPH-dependent 2,4-dienoyl-CoA reductase/sulfur reductase-like enzyme